MRPTLNQMKKRKKEKWPNFNVSSVVETRALCLERCAKMRNSIRKHRENDSASNDVKIFEIAHQMKVDNLPDQFISAAVKTALDFEGVADLLQLWSKEKNEDERTEIIVDIQELIDACQSKAVVLSEIKMNDLDSISKDIRSFKDSLLSIVDQKGGISHLAELTGIPQPSLSRFFNSNSMPRRVTLLKIAKALKLGSIDKKILQNGW